MKVGDRVLIESSGYLDLDGVEGNIVGAHREQWMVDPDANRGVFGAPFVFNESQLKSLESAPEGPTVSIRSTIVVRWDGIEDLELTEAQANVLLSNLMAVL